MHQITIMDLIIILFKKKEKILKIKGFFAQPIHHMLKCCRSIILRSHCLLI